MNARIFEKSENEASALGGDPLPGRALFLPGAHWLARTGYGFMLLFYLVALVAVVSTFTAHPLDWRDAVGTLLMILVPLVIATNLRTSAVYGSAHGLETVRWGVRRTVAWSKVGSAEYAWWSLNHSARVARLTLHQEKPRTILFFANDRVLAELEGMRAVYASR